MFFTLHDFAFPLGVAGQFFQLKGFTFPVGYYAFQVAWAIGTNRVLTGGLV